MNSNDHQRLYRLLEFKVLSPKRKKLVAAHVLEGVSLARGCSMLALNVGRESRREDITACLAAYRRSQDPEGKDELYETTRRLDLLWNGVNNLWRLGGWIAIAILAAAVSLYLVLRARRERA